MYSEYFATFLVIVISSPEPKTQVSFSNQRLLSVVVVVFSIVVFVVNFKHFCLLVQNH